ncbi:uncharacterized protein LOC119394823 [Rhipicephalus sanguineus]|uniref:uncharacterized protein LOC119394823 n=1 Tax=Rhipicephalus sanguineus TaxID=34632 RepID=UPI001893E546|nr:uncharacterized protein LOC119394823 [Rhipicephalus sanguineus]
MPETSAVPAKSLNTKVSHPPMPPVRGFLEHPSAAAVMAKQQQNSQGFNHPVCYTPSCVWLGKQLRAILNPLVDPCDNFNEHVCGRFDSVSDSDSTIDAYDRAVQDDLVRGVNTMESSSLSPDSARKKAADLALGCFSRHSSPNLQHDVLDSFMKDEQLNVQKVEGDLDESYESLLSLHVRLSFHLPARGLFHITPSTKPGELQILLDTSTVPGQAQFLRSMPRGDGAKYLGTLQPVDFRTTTAAKVSIRGLKSTFFAEALAAHTPYGPDTIVEVDQRLLQTLENLIDAVGKQDLYFFTSWNVLRELGPYVDNQVFRLYDQPHAYALCIRKVRLVMAVPLAATTFYVENTAQSYLEAMTRKLVYCVAKNASSWLRKLPDPYSSPPSMSVIVGYPASEDTDLKMDQKYNVYPVHNLSFGVFLSDWLVAAQRRSTHLNLSDVSFDPFVLDTVVSRDGSYVALPAAVVHVMYRYDAVDAFKHGAIGHMIAKRFIQRLSSTGKWPRECSQPAGSKATSVPENLLAYQCVADGLQSDLTLNSSAAMWLPMHLHLTPWRQLFTMDAELR